MFMEEAEHSNPVGHDSILTETGRLYFPSLEVNIIRGVPGLLVSLVRCMLAKLAFGFTRDLIDGSSVGHRRARVFAC